MPRNLSDKDIASCIVEQESLKEERPSQQKNLLDVDERKQVYASIPRQEFYDEGFPRVFDEDHPFAVAKTQPTSTSEGYQTTYYIKFSSGGPIDPYCLYDSDLFRKLGDESVWKWTQVEKRVFDYYVLYLKTKNKLYFRNAIREKI